MEPSGIISGRSIRIIIMIFDYKYSLLCFPTSIRIGSIVSKCHQEYYTFLFLLRVVLVRIKKVAYLQIKGP